jgi:Replication protein
VSLPAVQFEERLAPSRPFRLGTRRRKPRQAVSAVPEAGASRSPGRRAPSLDTGKQLATTDSKTTKRTGRNQASGVENPVTAFEWLRSRKTEGQLWQEQLSLHRQLLTTVRRIMDSWRAKGVDDEAKAWLERYSAVQVRLEDEKPEDAYVRVKAWLKANKPQGSTAEWLKWERALFAIGNCGREWIGYRAACCGEARSGTIAVPIGCNHRLCPLCAWHRSQRARVRVKTMYDKLTHPVMVTLTIPNLPKVSKHTFTRFRQCIRQWIAQRKELCRGGVYSIETTYNRREKTWHVHAHILGDFAQPLPSKHSQKVDFFGARVLPFTAMKWRMEFDWLQLTSSRWGKRPKDDPPAKSLKAKAKWRAAWDNYWFTFGEWVRAKRKHSTIDFKVKYGGKWYLRKDLTEAESADHQVLEAWNRKNTRVFHIEPVTDRDGAAREVLKYITKVADFGDIPEAVEQFCNAVKGARLVQTFGSWYGFNLETQFDPEHMDDWGERKCACGLNHWEKIGVFYAHDVEMDEAGRWHLKRTIGEHCRGTVPRPTIRALEAREEDGSCNQSTYQGNVMEHRR